MLVVTRYVVPEPEAPEFAAQARAALDALRGRPGCRAAVLGRAVDEATAFEELLSWDGGVHVAEHEPARAEDADSAAPHDR